MAETEAACLLRTGALYTKRVGLGGPEGSLIFAGVKRGMFSLYFDDAPIYHFDLEGRWQRAFIDGIHYRKSFDNVVDAIDRVREGDSMVIKRRTLGFVETTELDEKIRSVAIDLRERKFTPKSAPGDVETLSADDLESILDRIASWDSARWFAHREKYVAAYGREPIFVPPDAQNTIVLQATAGRFFRTPGEFADHVKAVTELLGRRAIGASGVFLADGSLLTRPMDDLIAYLEIIGSAFSFDLGAPKRPKDRPFDRAELNGIDIAYDAQDEEASLPDGNGWKALSEGRVRRLTITPNASATGLSRLVENARNAGITVSILLTHGRERNPVLEARAQSLATLPLGARDMIYLIDEGDSSEPELIAIRTWLKESLEPVRKLGAKVAVYNPDKQWS